jgi:hypothetical protein
MPSGFGWFDAASKKHVFALAGVVPLIAFSEPPVSSSASDVDDVHATNDDAAMARATNETKEER